MPEMSFLAFSIGPVQGFISAAYTVRDLWTGSYLLAWLTRKAMKPILEDPALGRSAFVSPDMRIDPFTERQNRSPCLPNRFVAEVPAERASDLAKAVRDRCVAEWSRAAAGVRKLLDEQVQNHLASALDVWRDSVDRLWDKQVHSYFDLRVTVLPWSACDERILANFLAQERRATSGSAEDRAWTDRAEYLGALLASAKAIRPVPICVPEPDAKGRLPQKCTLLGSYEQLGPAEFGASTNFWEGLAKHVHPPGGRTRPRERLCAISLIKRFALPGFLKDELKNDHPEALLFDDTATVAATEWLEADAARGAPALYPNRSRDTWSGQWLHWSRPNQDAKEDPCPGDIWRLILDKRRLQGTPPTYYAILMLDGDHMGKKHQERSGKNHRQAISRALAIFALDHVPKVVKRHQGTLIYSGGDDALVLLPTSQALACAAALNRAFADAWRQELPDNDPATLSSGVAVVHYKEDLRHALDLAHRAEKAAKNAGRNLLRVTTCRRSGEHSSVHCPWDFIPIITGWVSAFLGGASDRWAYHLAAELSTLEGLPYEAMKAEILRQVNRAEGETRRLLGASKEASAGQRLAEQFTDYRERMQQRDLKFTDDKALRHFVTLCQTASFLARGRDQ